MYPILMFLNISEATVPSTNSGPLVDANAEMDRASLVESNPDS